MIYVFLYILGSAITFCVMSYLLGTLDYHSRSSESDCFEATIMSSCVWPFTMVIVAVIAIFNVLQTLHKKLYDMSRKQVK